MNGRAGPDPAHGGPLPQATLPELIGRLINDVSDLADRQIELAKQEIGEAKDEAIWRGQAPGHRRRHRRGCRRCCWSSGPGPRSSGFSTGCSASSASRRRSGRSPWRGSAGCSGVAVPAAAAFFAYKRFIRRGISQAMAIWPPLPRTRETLKEDLEWVRHLRTRSDEITALRGDMTAAIDELERRVRGGLRSVATTEARITSARTARRGGRAGARKPDAARRGRRGRRGRASRTACTRSSTACASATNPRTD